MKKIKNSRQGFTLLELLVVVLIIGILAAIALPQYRMAVLKSKFAKVKSNVQALADAMQRYYLLNNEYPYYTLQNLDIEVKNKDDEDYYTTNKRGDVGGQIRRNGKVVLNYYIVLDESNHNENINSNTYYCIAYDGTGFHTDIADMLNKLCQQETGKTQYSYKTANYTWYAY